MNVWICLIFWFILIDLSYYFFSSYFSAFCSEPTPPTPHGWIYGDIKMSNHRKYWGVPETKIIECLQNMPINSFHSTSTFAASGTKCIFTLFKKAVKRELLIFALLHFQFQLLCIKQHHDDEMCQNKSAARINSNSQNLNGAFILAY